MKLTWIAHSCFEVNLKDGKKIVIDPFDDTIGYDCPDLSADIVLVSHDHFDHNYVKRVKGEYELIKDAGEYIFGDLKITAISCFHDKEQGALRGSNLIFIIESEGVRLAHFGDLGHMPSEELYNKIGKVDVLLIPVGGVFTVDGKEAFEICRRIEPNTIIPMHYKTNMLDMGIDNIQTFINANDRIFDVSVRGDSSLELDSSSLKKRTRIFVMQPVLE